MECCNNQFVSSNNGMTCWNNRMIRSINGMKRSVNGICYNEFHVQWSGVIYLHDILWQTMNIPKHPLTSPPHPHLSLLIPPPLIHAHLTHFPPHPPLRPHTHAHVKQTCIRIHTHTLTHAFKDTHTHTRRQHKDTYEDTHTQRNIHKTQYSAFKISHLLSNINFNI